MSFQAFDKFQVEETEDEETTYQDIDSPAAPERSEKPHKPSEKKESIGYYTHSFKPSVRQTILTSDDFMPMAKVKSEKAVPIPRSAPTGNGKKAEKNQAKQKKESKSKITKEVQEKKQSRNQKSNITSTKVKGRKEPLAKKSPSTKAVKTNKAAPIDILHNIIDKTKTKPLPPNKNRVKKVQSKINNLGKKNQVEKSLEKQLKSTLEALVQTTLSRFLKLK